MKPAVLSKLCLFHDSYAQSLASTRILKHSEQSSRGSCGENLAWASYDQSGAGFYYRFHVQGPAIYCTAHGQIQSVVWEGEQLGCISPGFPPTVIPSPPPPCSRARRHDSLQRYARLMRRLGGVKSGCNKCNNCKHLVSCVHR